MPTDLRKIADLDYSKTNDFTFFCAVPMFSIVKYSLVSSLLIYQ